MTLSKRTSLLALTIATATTLTVSLSGHELEERAVAQSPNAEHSLIGAWLTRIRPRNCQTGEILPVPPSLARAFGLFTVHQGGTASEYGIGPGQTPATRSPGHGVWQREPGWNHYSYAFTFTRYDATGLFVGSTRVRSVLVLDAGDDGFAANSAVEVLDADGNVTQTACTTVTGTRFE
jgi:hypothetical protein